MAFVFPPELPVAVPVASSSDEIAVRRVYCVGRNYAAHAREMGSDPEREPPFFFCKPANAVVPVMPWQKVALTYPSQTQNYHYEVELVAVIGKSGEDIAANQALDHVWGYAVGLDMTRRDLQIKMREVGRPWEIGKAFDDSAPIGPIHPAARVGHISQGGIWLNVNGVRRQTGDVSQMIWSVAETVAYLSRLFRLEPGDLIYTGTPEGVGPVQPGDTIHAGIDRLGELAVKII